MYKHMFVINLHGNSLEGIRSDMYVISITHVPGAKVEGWYEYCETSLPVYKPAQSY